MKKVTLPSLFILILLQISCSESDLPKNQTELYAGTWQIQNVTKDGVPQNEWSNVILTIEQTNDFGGTYELPATPYDTVWNSSGTWESVDERSFLLNDTLFVNYWLRNDSLYLSKFLPWTDTSIPCDINDPEIDACPLGLGGGVWLFFLTK